MKTAIVYYSNHHGNTKKLLDAIVKQYPDVVLIDAAASPSAELSGYGIVGFASGIYFSKFHDSVLKFAEKNLGNGQDVFFLYTCGSNNPRYNESIRKIADEKGARVLGTYACRGYDTFGPFKLVGGIAKGHPNQGDLDGAVAFFRLILENNVKAP